MHAQPSIHSLSAELELILASPQLAPGCHIPTLISLMQRNQCWNMAATKPGASPRGLGLGASPRGLGLGAS